MEVTRYVLHVRARPDMETQDMPPTPPDQGSPYGPCARPARDPADRTGRHDGDGGDKDAGGDSGGDDDGPLLPARAVCARYRIVDRTLDRWLRNSELNFPRPLVINRRRYFRARELQAWERKRAG